MQEDRDELDPRLDGILDRALTRYAEQEPLAGLEQRVLARVSRTRRQGSSKWGNSDGLSVIPIMENESKKVDIRTCGDGLEEVAGLEAAAALQPVPRVKNMDEGHR